MDDFIEVPNDPSISYFDGNFTVEYWIRFDSGLGLGSNRYILGKWGHGGGNDDEYHCATTAVDRKSVV